MTARRGRGNQLLGISAEKAENLLVSLANWERPRTPVDELSFSEYRKLRDAGKDLPPSAPSDDAWLRRLKAQTGKYWPDLWERTGEPPDITKEWALAILGRVRYYLQSFWKT